MAEFNEYDKKAQDYTLQLNALSKLSNDEEAMERILKEEKEEVEEVEVKEKKVDLNFTGDLIFKFDDVVLPEDGEIEYKDFNFNVFSGMASRIEALVEDYKKDESRGIYSPAYMQDKRLEVIAEYGDILSEYFERAKKQLRDLRNPTARQAVMTDSDQMLNMLKRLNNSIVCSEMMRTATVEDLASLYDQNKQNKEVRSMIRLRAHHIFRVVKDRAVKDQALQLFLQIKDYERTAQNVEYFEQLDEIERTLDYIYSSCINSTCYPVNLQDGFSGYRQQKLFA